MGTASVIPMPESGKTADVSGRYDRAYRVAQVNISLGEFVKAVGILAFALMVVGTIAFSGRSPEALLAGTFLAVAGGLALHCLGAILCAQGEILRATLDAATNSSPFLTTAEKARLMAVTRIA